MRNGGETHATTTAARTRSTPAAGQACSASSVLISTASSSTRRTRSKYLNLQTQQLFFTVQEKSDTPKNEGSQNFKLDFKNAVFEIIAAVRNKTGGVETGSPWKFGGSEPDAITGQPRRRPSRRSSSH